MDDPTTIGAAVARVETMDALRPLVGPPPLAMLERVGEVGTMP